MSEEYQVRIKPLNRKRGYKVRTLVHRGKRYREADGWIGPIPKWLGDELAELTQTDDAEKLIFDVVSIEEAQRIEELEVAAAEVGTAAHVQPFNMGLVRGVPAPEAAPAPADPPAPAEAAPAPSSRSSRPRRRRG